MEFFIGILVVLKFECDKGYHFFFSKHGPGVNYFQTASDQALN